MLKAIIVWCVSFYVGCVLGVQIVEIAIALCVQNLWR